MAEEREVRPAPPEGSERDADASPDLDAIGLDKRRQVIGGSYGPSIAKQATMYGAFLAVLAALVGGFILLANELDQPPKANPDRAPWTGNDRPPRPLE